MNNSLEQKIPKKIKSDSGFLNLELNPNQHVLI